MKVFEVMSGLSEAAAGADVRINICISLSELMSGIKIDDDLYSLNLKVSEVELDGAIQTEL